MTRRGVSPARVLAAVVIVLSLGLVLGPVLGPLDWLVQAAWHLLAGWAYYLGRTVPRLNPDPAEFAVAAVALAVLAVGGHRVGRWLGPPLLGRPWRAGWTARSVGLLVLLFACGTAAIGLTHQAAWLARSPDSLRRSGGIREAAGRTWTLNNLKQLGLAAHNHGDLRGTLPAPRFGPDGRPLHSWHTSLLPYLEQEPLFRRIDLSRPWTDPANREPVEVLVAVFDHPFAPVPGDGPKPAYLVPNARVLDRPRRLGETDFPLGIANTVLTGEAITDARPWADPLNWRDAQRPLGSPGGFAGVPGRPVQVLMADGSVRGITPAGWGPVMQGQPPGDD